MNLNALDIFLDERKVGVLFQYGDMLRFQVDADYAQDSQRPTLSVAIRAAKPGTGCRAAAQPAGRHV